MGCVHLIKGADMHIIYGVLMDLYMIITVTCFHPEASGVREQCSTGELSASGLRIPTGRPHVIEPLTDVDRRENEHATL